MNLSGKNVVYVGGFGGIGQECLREFLDKGVQKLAIFDLLENAAMLQELQSQYPSANIYYTKLNITSVANVEAAYKKAAANMGRFDVVVNGAGFLGDCKVDLTLQINVHGLIHSTLTAMSFMSKSSGGQGGIIVNIASVAGLEPLTLVPIYSASKFAVMGFTRSLAHPLHFEQTGISFITICPGFTSTPLLDNPGDSALFKFTAPLLDNFCELHKYQTPAECAKNLVKAVEMAKNGAVWLLDLGEMKEIEYPVFWKPTAKDD